jgi:hypothetical protein
MRIFAEPVATESFEGNSEQTIPSNHEHGLFMHEDEVTLLNTWVNLSSPLVVQKAADFCLLDGVIEKPAGIVSNKFGQLEAKYWPDRLYEYPVYFETLSTNDRCIYITTAGELLFASPVVGLTLTQSIQSVTLYGLTWRTV